MHWRRPVFFWYLWAWLSASRPDRGARRERGEENGRRRRRAGRGWSAGTEAIQNGIRGCGRRKRKTHVADGSVSQSTCANRASARRAGLSAASRCVRRRK